MTENNFTPRTPLGETLLGLRTKAVDVGMRLLTEEEIRKRMEVDEMAGDVYVIKCAECGGKLEYKCTYDDDGNLCILVELCDDCATDTYNDGYEEGHEDGYNEGYDEGYVEGCE